MPYTYIYFDIHIHSEFIAAVKLVNISISSQLPFFFVLEYMR